MGLEISATSRVPSAGSDSFILGGGEPQGDSLLLVCFRAEDHTVAALTSIWEEVGGFLEVKTLEKGKTGAAKAHVTDTGSTGKTELDGNTKAVTVSDGSRCTQDLCRLVLAAEAKFTPGRGTYVTTKSIYPLTGFSNYNVLQGSQREDGYCHTHVLQQHRCTVLAIPAFVFDRSWM